MLYLWFIQTNIKVYTVCVYIQNYFNFLNVINVVIVVVLSMLLFIKHLSACLPGCAVFIPLRQP